MYVFASIWHIKVLCSELHPSKIITHGNCLVGTSERKMLFTFLWSSPCAVATWKDKKKRRRRSHDRFCHVEHFPATPFVFRGVVAGGGWGEQPTIRWHVARLQCASDEGRSRSRKVSVAVEKRKKAFRNTLLERSSAVVDGSLKELDDDSHGDANRGVCLLSRGWLKEKLWNVAESGLVQGSIRRKLKDVVLYELEQLHTYVILLLCNWINTSL